MRRVGLESSLVATTVAYLVSKKERRTVENLAFRTADSMGEKKGQSWAEKRDFESVGTSVVLRVVDSVGKSESWSDMYTIRPEGQYSFESAPVARPLH